MAVQPGESVQSLVDRLSATSTAPVGMRLEGTESPTRYDRLLLFGFAV